MFDIMHEMFQFDGNIIKDNFLNSQYATGERILRTRPFEVF